MTHVLIKESNPNSPRKGLDVFTPVTVIECPALKVAAVRYYIQHEEGHYIIAGELRTQKPGKFLSRILSTSKKTGTVPAQFDRVRVLAYTQPHTTGMGVKKPQAVEIPVGGKTLEEQSIFAQSLLDKELSVSDVFKELQFVDVHAVTKGKGFSGVVKKFGVKRLQHKSEKKVRGIGTLGSWHPNQVKFTVAQPGKWGYHLRTEYNKIALKVGKKGEDITPAGGFLHYGNVKNDYLFISGSVPGAVKRPVTITAALRPKEKLHPMPISYINKESPQ